MSHNKNASDPKKWVMKQQTEIKHQILEEYLKRFAVILHKGNLAQNRGRLTQTNLHYIDGFAGRGIYDGGQPGSPIIAMKVADEIRSGTEGGAILKTHAIELDSKNFESLEIEVQKAKQQHPGAEIVLRQGAFLDHVQEVVGGLRQHEFAFVFIDPFGYEGGIDMDTVVNLILRKKSEVFITFMSSFISRFLDDHTGTKDGVMSSIFGGDEWKAVRHQKGLQEHLTVMYGREIQRRAEAKGVKVLVSVTPVEFSDRDQNIYHLIHLAQHPKARVAMDAAVRKAAILKPPQGMMLAMQRGQLEQIAQRYLSTRARGRTTALQLAAAIWMEPDFWGVSWPDGMREAFKILEDDRVIEITRDGQPLNNRMKVGEEDLVRLRA